MLSCFSNMIILAHAGMYLVYIFAFIVAISLKVEKSLSLASICIQFVRVATKFSSFGSLTKIYNNSG